MCLILSFKKEIFLSSQSPTIIIFLSFMFSELIPSNVLTLKYTHTPWKKFNEVLNVQMWFNLNFSYLVFNTISLIESTLTNVRLVWRSVSFQFVRHFLSALIIPSIWIQNNCSISWQDFPTFNFLDPILQNYYRVCHGFRITKLDDYFWVTFDLFWSKRCFWSNWGNGKLESDSSLKPNNHNQVQLVQICQTLSMKFELTEKRQQR